MGTLMSLLHLDLAPQDNFMTEILEFLRPTHEEQVVWMLMLLKLTYKVPKIILCCLNPIEETEVLEVSHPTHPMILPIQNPGLEIYPVEEVCTAPTAIRATLQVRFLCVQNLCSFLLELANVIRGAHLDRIVGGIANEVIWKILPTAIQI